MKLKIFIIILLFARIVTASPPSDAGFYLSYEQRLLATHALISQGKTDQEKSVLFKKVQNKLESVMTSPEVVIEVSNFQDFLRQFRGDWPNTHSVDLDLEIIEKRSPLGLRKFVSKSPKVQRQIDSYLIWQKQELAKVAATFQFSSLFQSDNGDTLVQEFSQKIPPEIFSEKRLFEFSEILISKQMKELEQVGSKMAESGFGGQADAAIRIFMQTLIGEYFSRLSSDSKKLILSSYLGGDLNISDIKKFEMMVQNSGPQFQKFLQIVARQAGLSPEMLEVFRHLENSVRPVPWVQVEEMLKQDQGQFKFTYFEKKPLGVGTMAQVHRAKILDQGELKNVVVRFIKPGIAKRVEEDRFILNSVAEILDENPEFRKSGAPKLKPIINDITATVTAELSQEETIKRQIQAKQSYDKQAVLNTLEYKNIIEFHVPEIFLSKGPSRFMVQEMVFGKKLDKESGNYARLIPGMKKSVVENLAILWANEVLFGGGFYHSDLHQGNFLVEVTDPRIRVNILDYGMGGVIGPNLQKQVMILGAGIELLNPDLISKAFWKISQAKENLLNENQFRSLVEERVRLIQQGKETKTSIENWSSWVLDQGVRLPYDFISLNRGIVIVNKLLQDAGSSLSVTKILKIEARKNLGILYKTFVLEEKMSHRDLVKLGWTELLQTLAAGRPSLKVIRCESVFAF